MQEMKREDVVIVEAIRTPFGRRNGGLSSMHSIDLLASVLSQLVRRSGVDAAEVGQVLGGCVGQVGMQAMNVTRQAWLAAGLPLAVPASTVDAQCGSSQQALTLAYGLIRGGVVDAAVACGVEVMSRVPMGATIPSGGVYGKPVTRQYWEHHEFTSQFEGAERIADRWGITRDECDQFGKESQDRAAAARDAGRFDSQLVEIQAPDLDDDGKPTGATHTVSVDEGIRVTTLDGLAGLRPSGRPDGVHTAGTSSQISDGASAVLLMSGEAARRAGLTPIASIVESCLVGSDPVLMLTGPIAATELLLGRSGMAISDIDVVEINEAFAAVVLAWERELKPDMSRVNPNGGAIALGHPLGATGTGLTAKAVHELVRADREHAIVTMCCGGGLGTGTLIRRIG
jgi:acetyl-CoA C-acetyltransferase